MDVFSNQGYLYGFCILIKKIFLAHTFWASQVVLVVKNQPANTGDARDWSLIPGSGRSLEEEMATHSKIPAGRIPWTEDPDGLQSMGLQRVGRIWAHTFWNKHFKRKKYRGKNLSVSYLLAQKAKEQTWMRVESWEERSQFCFILQVVVKEMWGGS